MPELRILDLHNRQASTPRLDLLHVTCGEDGEGLAVDTHGKLRRVDPTGTRKLGDLYPSMFPAAMTPDPVWSRGVCLIEVANGRIPAKLHRLREGALTEVCALDGLDDQIALQIATDQANGQLFFAGSFHGHRQIIAWQLDDDNAREIWRIDLPARGWVTTGPNRETAILITDTGEGWRATRLGEAPPQLPVDPLDPTFDLPNIETETDCWFLEGSTPEVVQRCQEAECIFEEQVERWIEEAIVFDDVDLRTVAEATLATWPDHVPQQLIDDLGATWFTDPWLRLHRATELIADGEPHAAVTELRDLDPLEFGPGVAPHVAHLQCLAALFTGDVIAARAAISSIQNTPISVDDSDCDMGELTEILDLLKVTTSPSPDDNDDPRTAAVRQIRHRRARALDLLDQGSPEEAAWTLAEGRGEGGRGTWDIAPLAATYLAWDDAPWLDRVGALATFVYDAKLRFFGIPFPEVTRRLNPPDLLTQAEAMLEGPLTAPMTLKGQVEAQQAGDLSGSNLKLIYELKLADGTALTESPKDGEETVDFGVHGAFFRHPNHEELLKRRFEQGKT